MQRITIAVLFVIVSGFLLWPNAPLLAASPTPTTAPSVVVPTVPEGIKIPNGSNNVRIESQHGPDYEPTPGDPYINTVPSENVSTTNFKIPKPLDPISSWLMNVIRFTSAKQIKDNIVPHQNNLYISGQARRCIFYPGGTDVKTGATYKTELVDYLPKLMTATELLSAQTARNVVKPISKKYDFRGPAYEVDEAPPCGSDGTGTAQDPKPVNLTQTFSFAAWWQQFLEKIQVKRELVSKQLTPEADRIHCLLNGCTQGGANLDYIGDSKKQETVQASGGIAEAGFRTNTMDTTKGEDPNGQEENFTKTNTSYTKQMENSADLIKCSLIPPAQRAKLGLAGKCSGFVKEPCSATKLPELKASSDCKLQNNSLGLPDKLIAAIEAAASTFKVPPSLMVGVIYGEGSFNPGSIFLNDKEVEKYLNSCTTLPNCNPGAPVIKNIVPFFQQYWPSLADAVKTIDPKRTPNACNLLDGIFAMAKDLSKNQFGSPAFAGKTCFGIALNTGKSQSSGCSWSDTAAETAIRVWEFGTGWDNATKSCATKLNSCLTGGGLAAQCPTGGDSCETIGNRYTQKSHNGCVWDIYKKN